MASRLRLVSGLTVLDDWSAKASQSDRNLIYDALFSIVDGSVYLAYEVFDDARESREFFVLVRAVLVAKIFIHHFDAFGIVYIGPLDGRFLNRAPKEQHGES